MNPEIERAVELMRLAAEYLRNSSDSDRTIFYDGTDCDGECLAVDLEGCAESLL